MNFKNDDLYMDAWEKWGETAQLDMLIEECSELIHAVSKYKRGKPNSLKHIAEELADVEIMIGQTKCALNLRIKSGMYYEEKIARLGRLLSRNPQEAKNER